MTVARSNTPPVRIPWLKKPIPPTLSGLFISGNRADASLSRAFRSREEESKSMLDMRLDVFVGVIYCGLGRVKSDV